MVEPVVNIPVGLLIVTTLAAVMVALGLLARGMRRRGGAGPAIGAAMAAYDEAMHSTAHDSFVEMQADDDRTVPMPSPDKT
ncbi:hypothetical protein ACVXZ4_07045 [Lacisediminihabitans sp. FW035]